MAETHVDDLRGHLDDLSDPSGVLASLIEHTSSPLALYNPAGFCVRVNPAYRDLFGEEPRHDRELSDDEVLGRSGVLFWVRRAFAGEVITTPSFWYEHAELPRPDARTRIALSARAFPLHDSRGDIEFVAITFRDETDSVLLAERRRQEAEEPSRLIDEIQRADLERRTSEEQFRAVFEQCEDGVMITDDMGRVLDINPSGCRIFGARVQDIVGSRYWDHIGDVAASRPNSEKLLEQGHLTTEVQVWRADGQLRDLELRAVANFLPHRHLTTFLDVTERNEALHALQRSEAHLIASHEQIQRLNQDLEARVTERTSQLEAANRDLEAFAYSVSHDLRAPLRAINGFAEILNEEAADDLSEMSRTALDRISASVRRMDGLIDGLLALSRLGRRPTEICEISPGPIVEEALEEVGIRPETPGVEVTVSDLPKCRADAALLRQVFVNLIGNALKFSRDRTPARIAIGSRHSGGEDIFYVKDNGIGFDMRHAPKVFDVFQRLTSADGYEGTGVGLAIVDRIIRRHGGRIWAESAPDRGATFSFTL